MPLYLTRFSYTPETWARLIDKPEVAPRSTRVRQRIARLEAQRQQRTDEAALHAALQRILGRLEDFASKVPNG